MEERFKIIVDFQPAKEADLKWKAWLKANDASTLSPDDIQIDTGRGDCNGKIGCLRRYRIRTSAMKDLRKT